jgi:PiT family inorganic phosphate transporter
MGVVFIALIVSGHLPADASSIPLWVKISAASAMALGTYAGGWRIIRTVGQRIAKIQPPGGFAAEATAGTVLWVTAHFGFPVSTTHTVSSAVLGSGAAGSKLSAVRWGVAGNIVAAWLITIPCAALVGSGVELLTRLPGGVFFALGVAAIAAVLALVARSHHLAMGKREAQDIQMVS